MVSTRSRTLVRTGLALALAIVIVGVLAGSAFAASVTVRVEGAQRTYYAGPAALDSRSVLDSTDVAHVESNNALSMLDAAAQVGAVPYVLDNTAYGLYVSSIGGELPVLSPPYPGWNYRVNGAYAMVAASEYSLKAGDSVLWYYGTYDASPTVAKVPASYVPVNTTATVTSEQLDPGGLASILPTACVVVGSRTATSAIDGSAGFHMSAPGDYGVRVEKDGFIRSALEILRVRYTTNFSAFSADKSKVKRGHRDTLSGQLSGVGKTPSGRRVDLLARKAGSRTWSVSSHTTTSRSGAFQFSPKVSRLTYYRVSFAGDSVFGPSTSPVLTIGVR